MSRRVRLRIDATPLAAGAMTGVGHVLLETVRALGDPRFADRIDLALFVPRSERAAVERVAPAGTRVIGVPLPRRVLGFLTRTPIPLDLLVGRGVYFFPNFRNWALTARSAGITFVHDACFAVAPELVPEPRRSLLAARMPGWLARSRLVATGTPSAAAEIAGSLGVPEGRLRVLPTTVDTRVFRPRPDAEVRAVKRRLGLSRYLLFVGSIEPRKNVAELVRAYAAADRPPGHTLLLVGGTSWEADDVHRAVRDAVAAGADVRFPDSFVEDEEMPALMTGADALALVSHHEGFGLPALEAVATGTPVVVSDIPGIRDALRGNEHAAVFVEPGDRKGLVRALEQAVTEPRRVRAGTIRPWIDAADALVGAAEDLSAGRPATRRR
ncbi:glycosyltransferase family 4 protein [Rathayibacter sp. ZW T2_19]|uniref:Glycosyltransferase family 4 protein n=1 Tax=Rathayibacter rubneri TaxID=2950106 RepID=A0A9X2ISR0_9MICO|nr:glycosyltransferase family 1 protein [Rathayibacter rubneri]MCM6761773.1 glycosyltransferase family 4 protein [Rathayibacter rubneri]